MVKIVQELDQVVIRFAGDSGDGMQVAGDRFTSATAVMGNDLATLPDFPAEIRAPAGTLAGVSGFQLHFADHDILTPGDAPGVLVAMNPAALKTNVNDLVAGGSLIVNSDAFDDRGLAKAGYTSNPLTDGSLGDYQVFEVPLNKLTLGALSEVKGLNQKDQLRSKNMFALGLLSWMYSRPLELTETWIASKFASKPLVADANLRALKAGYAFGETTEIFSHTYVVKPAKLPPGTYRNISGNSALALGLVAAAQRSGLQMVLASYPITPASDILHELSRFKSFGIKTVQAEDEISAAGMALGAAFAGAIGVTTTSGPGMDLKSETIGLAISVELPMLIFDVQRAGPSTGMPTKTEQSDLLMAMYGRHGEAPLPILAPRSPADCFDVTVEAARIALKYRTPVVVLSDALLATGSEPWNLPNVDDLPNLRDVVGFATAPNHESGEFWPFLRDVTTFARPWAIPGTKGLEHRIGGLEKSDGRGGISYDPANHQRMVDLREAKIQAIAHDLSPIEPDSYDGSDTCVVGWGSTYGVIRAACKRIRKADRGISHIHLRYLNPFRPKLGEELARFKNVIVVENNSGHLWRMLRAEFLTKAERVNKVAGQPFKASELEAALIGYTDKVKS